MKIRSKLLSGFMLLAVMLSVAGVISIYEVTRLSYSVKKTMDKNYCSVLASNKMLEALRVQDESILLILSGRLEEGRINIESADSVFLQALSESKSANADNNVNLIILEIEKGYNKYKLQWYKPFTMVSDELNIGWYHFKFRKAFQEIKVKVENLSKTNSEALYISATTIENRAHRAIMPGTVAILAAVLFIIFFYYLIIYYYVIPLSKVLRNIESTTKYQTPYHSVIETKDELKELENSIEDFINYTENRRKQ